jgi:glycosyltransferase involved in cell wall biosynthesis
MMDQPLVSVVVTTYFSAKYLERCLASIRNQTYKNVELIVVDTNSTDGTQKLAVKYADKVFFGQANERSAKRNYGASQAAGKYVLIADSDMYLSPEVVESCILAISSADSAKAVVIPEQSTGTSFWAKCKALERSFYVGVDWMEAARFFARDVFLEVGGYDVANTGSEDYDLPQRVKEKYGHDSIRRVSTYIIQNEVDLSLLKSCKKKYYYAKSFPKYAANKANAGNFRKQSSLLRRYRLFISQPSKLFRKPLIGIGMLFMKTCEFLAGGTGYLLARLCSSV